MGASRGAPEAALPSKSSGAAPVHVGNRWSTEAIAGMTRDLSSPSHSEPAGVALIEVLIMILVISIMTSLAVNAAMTKLQKAQLARCFAELRSIQARIDADLLEGGLPAPDTFCKVYWHGVKPGPYY
jgi:hypothetical protein